MKRKTKLPTPPTDQELVDAVAAAGLDRTDEHGHYRLTPDEQVRLDELLESLGVDHVDLAQARYRLMRARLGLS